MAEESKRPGQGKRRIPASSVGRLRFQQGDPHALDVQLDEARNVNEQLAATAAQLSELLAALGVPTFLPPVFPAKDSPR